MPSAYFFFCVIISNKSMNKQKASTIIPGKIRDSITAAARIINNSQLWLYLNGTVFVPVCASWISACHR